MLPVSCWSETLLLQLLAMIVAGSNAEAESQFKSSTYCNPSSSQECRTNPESGYRPAFPPRTMVEFQSLKGDPNNSSWLRFYKWKCAWTSYQS